MFHKIIKPPDASNDTFSSVINYIGTKIREKFEGSSLIQDKLTFTYRYVVNIYFVYEINLWSSLQVPNFALINSLFGTVKLTMNLDPNKYEYSGYGVEFGACGSFSLSNGSGSGRNVVIFDVDMTLMVHIDNEKKDILIIGNKQTNSSDDTSMAAEKEYSKNFTEPQKKFCLSLHYNQVNSYIFVNGVRINSRQKILR